MSTLFNASLPIVDISPFLDANATAKQRAQTVESLHQACKDVGFFYLVGHGVSEQDMNHLLGLGKQFFELPDEVKRELAIGKNDHAR